MQIRIFLFDKKKLRWLNHPDEGVKIGQIRLKLIEKIRQNFINNLIKFTNMVSYASQPPRASTAVSTLRILVRQT